MKEPTIEHYAKIGLSMIVLNEEINIERSLVSVLSAGLIDAVSVVDTGSTDRTVELIKAVCSHFKIPFNIEIVKFTDFADARNLTLPYLKQQACDYIFQLNADEQVFVNTNFKKEHLVTLAVSKDMLYMAVRSATHTNRQARILRLDSDLEWAGLCHEFIQSSTLNFQNSGLIDDNLIFIATNINRDAWSEQKKYNQLQQQEKLLMQQIEINPTQPRWVYYLADTLKEYNTPETNRLAIEQYEKRFAMQGGNSEEQYMAGLKSAEMYQVHKKMDAEKFIRLANVFNRPEHNFALSIYYRQKREIELSWEYSKKCIKHFGTIVPKITLCFFDIRYLFYMPYTHLLNGIVFDKSHLELKESIEALRKANESGIIPTECIDGLKKQANINGFKIFK